MNIKDLAPHEAIELHEILTFKTLCATKTATMSGFVSDSELKTLLSKDLSLSKKHISDLNDLLQVTQEMYGGNNR